MTENERKRAFEQVMCEAFCKGDVLLIEKELVHMGFFTAPASTKYHGNYEGGLFDHSFTVTKSLLSLTRRLELKWDRKESPYIVGMFHDLCKCDQYISKSDGTYEYNKNLILPGHGEKSVILAQRFLNLTEEEIICIRWHIGAFDEKEMWDKYGKAVEAYPNVLFTHTADMMASRINGI